jgi:FkbM family methyltransferase
MKNVDVYTYITRHYSERSVKIYCDLSNDKRANKIKSNLPSYIYPLSHKIWIYLISKHVWQTIIDIGANYGEFTCDADFYAKKYSPIIQSVEPAKKTFKYLRKTLKELNSKILIHNVCITDYEGQIIFKEGTTSSGGSKIQNKNSYFSNEDSLYEVPCMRLEKLIISHESALIKIDTEGNELRIISSLPTTLIEEKKLCFFIEINQIDFLNLLNHNSNFSLFLFNKWKGKFVKVKNPQRNFSEHIYYNHDGILTNSKELEDLILNFKIRFIERLKWKLLGRKSVV